MGHRRRRRTGPAVGDDVGRGVGHVRDVGPGVGVGDDGDDGRRRVEVEEEGEGPRGRAPGRTAWSPPAAAGDPPAVVDHRGEAAVVVVNAQFLLHLAA